MSEHLSREEIESYIARASAPAEILRIDDHLAACAVCMKLAKPAKKGDAIRELLESEVHDVHLSFETMSAVVDGAITGTEREIADVHLEGCVECADSYDELRALRLALDSDEISGVQSGKALLTKQTRGFAWWKFAIPAAAIILLGIVLWATFDLRKGSEELTNTSNSINRQATTNANELDLASNTPGSILENTKQATVASLNDAGGRIEIDSEGRLTGINSGPFEQKLRLAMTSQSVNISAAARELKSQSGTLMGPASPGVPFQLIGPVGRVIEIERPSFLWRPLQGAERYEVGVYDENFQLVAESPELKTTNWTPKTSLPRGHIYQWQVKAVVDGKELVSPTRPAAEAKFKIADAATAAEIQQARRTAGNSNLLMGIVYANAGMLPEAEREFQALVKKNPDSEVARKLLAKVRSAK